MSRLDSVIRRLRAQRDCLDVSVRLVADVPGPVLEFGLGNGRTYDHLRTLFPDREIFVFDRRIAAHPDCVPDAAHMLLGDFDDIIFGASNADPNNINSGESYVVFGGPTLATLDIADGISDGVISVFFTPTLAKILATLLVSLVLVVRPAGLFGEKAP